MNSRWISLGLSLLGVGGVGLTSWLAIKGHDEAKDKTDKKEKIFAYKWAILSGIGTSACILGSHHVSSKEIAALTASCTYLATNRDKIMKAVKNKLGEEEHKKLIAETGTEMVKSNPDSVSYSRRYERTGNGNERFLIWETGRYFISNRESVYDAEKNLNNLFFKRGRLVTWNDYYAYLKIRPDEYGEDLIIQEEDIKDIGNLDKPYEFDLVPTTDEVDDRVWIIYRVDEDGREV